MHVIYCYVTRWALCRYFDFTVCATFFSWPLQMSLDSTSCVSVKCKSTMTVYRIYGWIWKRNRRRHCGWDRCIIYKRSVEWMEFGKGYKRYFLGPLASRRNPFDLHLSPKCKKGCPGIQMFLESARNGCSSGRKIGYIASFRAVSRHYFRF